MKRSTACLNDRFQSRSNIARRHLSKSALRFMPSPTPPSTAINSELSVHGSEGLAIVAPGGWFQSHSRSIKFYPNWNQPMLRQVYYIK